MSLCASCGQPLSGDAALCPHHHCVYGDDWHEANRIVNHLYMRGDYMEGTWRREQAEKRFWRNVNKDGPTSKGLVGQCWIWQGRLDGWGYGLFWRNGEYVYAHRFAFELEAGITPKHYDIIQVCKNRTCVRYEHLIISNPDPGWRPKKLILHRLPGTDRDDDFWAHTGEAA